MLAAKRRDPKIIHGYRPARSLQFQPNLSLGRGRISVDVEDSVKGQVLAEPMLVVNAMPGLCDAEAEFAQRDHVHGRNGDRQSVGKRR